MSENSLIASARWADPDYIADKFTYDPEKGDIWIGRNPHCFEDIIGYRDDRHIMVCAGAGSGKGRSFIVNNLSQYRGSTITYDPKGELPQILAPRRGYGDKRCLGMGQDVFVLDPLNRANVDDMYRGFCDPVSMLDPQDPELSSWCARLARSLVKQKKSDQGSDWADKGIAFASLVIEHVVTWAVLEDDRRNLHYVLQLIMEGDVEGAETINGHFARIEAEKNAQLGEGETPPKPFRVSPYEALLRSMIDNQDANRFLGIEARKLEREMKELPKYFGHVSGEAAEGLRWLRSASMERALQGWGDETRRFDPRRLKKEKMSVFIVMPVDDLDLYEPWLQSLFIGIFAAMRENQTKPDLPVLAVFDEFSSLGYQDYIASSLDNIRGAGMKLCFIVQNFGKMKKLYGDEMESFLTNSGLELYFGRVGQTAAEYIKKELGETEVVRLARSQNYSETENESVSESIAFGTTEGEGGSRTETEGSSQSNTKGRNFSWSKNVNWSDSKNWGSSDGKSMGRNYGPHVFYEGLTHSNNYGTQLNKNQGRSRSKSGGRTKSGGTSESETIGSNKSLAIGSSWNTSTSTTQTKTQGRTKGYSIGGGVAETFHKKPLLDLHEINTQLAALSEDDRDHQAYPGMMLVRVAGEQPFFVRRSNYDQDPYFEGRFSDDPLHTFLPLSEQPLLGYQYTPDHILTLTMPMKMVENGFEFETRYKAGQKPDPDSPIAAFYHREIENSLDLKVSDSVRIMDVYDDDHFKFSGEMIAIKCAKKVKARAFNEDIYSELIEAIDEKDRNEKLRLKHIEKMRFDFSQDNEKRVAEIVARRTEQVPDRMTPAGVVKNIIGPSLASGFIFSLIIMTLFNTSGFSILAAIVGCLSGWGLTKKVMDAQEKHAHDAYNGNMRDYNRRRKQREIQLEKEIENILAQPLLTTKIAINSNREEDLHAEILEEMDGIIADQFAKAMNKPLDDAPSWEELKKREQELKG